MAFRWPWAKPRQYPLIVDFNWQPTLPQGTESIMRHVPAAHGVMTLAPSDLILRPMPAGISYADFYRDNSDGCCDGLILDAIFQLLLDSKPDPRDAVRALFGDFWGQIFFLGSSFAARDSGAECVSFLNVETARVTGMWAIRYSTFTANPVRPDVPVFACYLTDEKRSA